MFSNGASCRPDSGKMGIHAFGTSSTWVETRRWLGFLSANARGASDRVVEVAAGPRDAIAAVRAELDVRGSVRVVVVPAVVVTAVVRAPHCRERRELALATFVVEVDGIESQTLAERGRGQRQLARDG